MLDHFTARRPRNRVVTGLFAVVGLLVLAPAAHAACRVTDFTDRTLSSLNEIQRLSFASQMTQTEFTRLKAAAPGSPNHYALIADSANVIEAKQAARAKIARLKIENSDYYMKIWASDFLNDEQIQRFTSCSSQRRPGVTYAGRPDGAAGFSLTFTHLTPVGVEKISIRPVASRNIANIAEFEAFLANLGEHDNFTAQTFAFRRSNPAQPAVVIFRAGFETPTAIYIPVYPAPEVRP